MIVESLVIRQNGSMVKLELILVKVTKPTSAYRKKITLAP
jgi:hypothetical protein